MTWVGVIYGLSDIQGDPLVNGLPTTIASSLHLRSGACNQTLADYGGQVVTLPYLTAAESAGFMQSHTRCTKAYLLTRGEPSLLLTRIHAPQSALPGTALPWLA